MSNEIHTILGEQMYNYPFEEPEEPVIYKTEHGEQN